MFLHKPPTKDLPPLKAKTSDVGRFYTNLETNESYPSITTVLGAQSKQGILEWKKRVGEDVANHISNQAATRGTAVHNMVEDHLNNINVDEVEKYKKQFLPRMMFNVLKPELIKINNIRLQEAAMYSSDYTVAGRVDCIGEYDGVLSVIDFKTSTKEKSEDWIENYFVQGSAYSQMYKEHFGEEVPQIVILITTEQGTTQVFKKNPYDYLEKLKQYVEEFYKTLP
jgi:ATP-dependent exoDNAse (exonuclease V) beta subunit